MRLPLHLSSSRPRFRSSSCGCGSGCWFRSSLNTRWRNGALFGGLTARIARFPTVRLASGSAAGTGALAAACAVSVATTAAVAATNIFARLRRCRVDVLDAAEPPCIVHRQRGQVNESQEREGVVTRKERKPSLRSTSCPSQPPPPVITGRASKSCVERWYRCALSGRRLCSGRTKCTPSVVGWAALHCVRLFVTRCPAPLNGEDGPAPLLAVSLSLSLSFG